MLGAVSRYPSRNDLAPFRNEVFQYPGAFVIDFEGFIGAETADFSLDIDPSPSISSRGLPHLIVLLPVSRGLFATLRPQVFYRIRYDFHLRSGLTLRGFPFPLLHLSLDENPRALVDLFHRVVSFTQDDYCIEVINRSLRVTCIRYRNSEHGNSFTPRIVADFWVSCQVSDDNHPIVSEH